MGTGLGDVPSNVVLFCAIFDLDREYHPCPHIDDLECVSLREKLRYRQNIRWEVMAQPQGYIANG